MKRILILALAAFALSGCIALDYHHGATPPPWHYDGHHVTHDSHGHHGVNHHYTNRYGWKSHRPYHNPCNC